MAEAAYPVTLSIVMLTYHHERFIAQAIDGIYAQDMGGISFEVIIGDDFSQDGTRAILEEYAAKYPEIQLVLHPHNMGEKGSRNFIDVLSRMRGKYMAFLEGDDYWIDPLKIKRQVAYLEAHPNAAGCFTDAILVDDSSEQIADHYFTGECRPYTQGETINRLKSRYASCTLVARTAAALPLPEWFKKRGTDYAYDILITSHGTLDCIGGTTGAYRIHGGGVWSGAMSEENHLELLERLDYVESHEPFRKNYRKEINSLRSEHLYVLSQMHQGKHRGKVRRYALRFAKAKGMGRASTWKIMIGELLMPRLYRRLKG